MRREWRRQFGERAGSCATRSGCAASTHSIADVVLLVDIEDGEFELLDVATLADFRNAVIFIERHDWAVVDGERKPARLLTDARELFDVTELRTTSRDPSTFPELQVFSDNDRWGL